MKKLTKLLIYTILFCSIAYTSCFDYCKPIEIPEDLEPIDWEKYNDVKTVYYNCAKFCSEKSEMEGRIVKVRGWVLNNLDGFAIGNDSIYNGGPAIFISARKPTKSGMYYITGKISLPCLETVNIFGRNCSKTAVEILADSVNFEKVEGN